MALLLPSLAFGYVFERNVPENIKQQTIADLAFIDSLRSGAGSPLHQQIFGTVDGPNYTKFFESRVTHIGMNNCGGGNAVACVIPWAGSSKIWFTQNYVRFSHPQVAKMMVVFHEARHTEDDNGNWHHATCPNPFVGEDGKEIASIWTGATLANEPACDVTPLGSYGSSSIMLKNIAKFCTNCSDKVKMDAGIYADDQFKRIIDADAKKQMRDDIWGA